MGAENYGISNKASVDWNSPASPSSSKSLSVSYSESMFVPSTTKHKAGTGRSRGLLDRRTKNDAHRLGSGSIVLLQRYWTDRSAGWNPCTHPDSSQGTDNL